MLLGAGEVNWEKHDSIVPFQAQELKDRRNLLRLCARMWEAGMLTYVSEPQALVSILAVVKKVDEMRHGGPFDTFQGDVTVGFYRLGNAPVLIPWLCGPGGVSQELYIYAAG